MKHLPVPDSPGKCLVPVKKKTRRRNKTPQPNGRKLAVVAGSGVLPGLAARAALAEGWPVKIYTVAEEQFGSGGEFKDLEPICQRITITRFGFFLKQLTKDGITDLVFLGKIHKEHIFKDLRFDLKTVWILSRMLNKNDDTFFYTVEKELKKIGVEVITQAKFLSGLLLKEGVYTRKKPSKSDWKDIEFGMFYAKKMGELDVGQTVVVKNQSLLAIEAMEGTDQCIRRGGLLSRGKGAVVCKSEKQKQDPRFDVPTIGISTLDSMKEAGADILAIEADKTFVVTPENVIAHANKLGIMLVATRYKEIRYR